jgi:hypothetical protein
MVADVILPVFPPKQAALVGLSEVDKAAGSVMVTDAVAVHKSKSVTVMVYVPALNPVADALEPPEGVQAYT